MAWLDVVWRTGYHWNIFICMLLVWLECTWYCISSWLLFHIHVKSSLATQHPQFWTYVYYLIWCFFSLHNSNDFLRKIIDMEMATTAFVIPLSFIYHIFNKHLLSIYYLLVSARDKKIMKFISVLKESQSTNKHRHVK